MVVAMASFLFVGCLGNGIIDDGDGDGDGDGAVEAAITFDPEYTNVSGTTFIPCEGAVTVTLPIPVAADYVVYVAVKDDEGEYDCLVALEPNLGRTIWTLAEYTPDTPDCCLDIDECEPLCVVALVKHPCCPGEEVALRVVSVDCTPPSLDLFVKFTDCEDVCVEPDPCDPPVPGVYMEWTSRTTDICETTDCCEDDCSGDGPWSLVIDPDPCLGPCDEAPGEGCPVEGVIECGCLAYADTGEVVYYVNFSFEDNVGNARTSDWRLTFNTDSLVEFTKGRFDEEGVYNEWWSPIPDGDGWYEVYDDCAEKR